ncbi:acylphosphatase [Rhodopseudomonas thermotolerans]|uniref:acylphosphatase n=2 Tax=Rhodopseudomonas TaxID=1073 RepID=A0A336JTA9_9BRAD|nr:MULTISPECIES: acylphosphatase [Rhodopseudomonas]RED32651.1 acylphosphatase [Rhodopseudomonas pentothenatexigens]REF93660.1 acylphosphatase [Rhodopseudomonas thermotolerans]SSW91546.1 acylphosphatase [Rhodopseudomonas pentothenatexigens]
MAEIIRQVTIRGRVQGVGYRAWLAHTAEAVGLHGWVRNRRDGSVEAVLAGRDEVVSEMIERCRRGPTAARVEAVIAETAAPDVLDLRQPGERFSILSTL